jgi:putative glutamine amidotransferase
MSFKPVIGINGEFRAVKKDIVPLSWYNTGYYDSVVAAGGLPALLPPLAEDRDLKQFLKMLDGLVVCGCALDLDPVRLGMERHPATRSMPLRREDFDRRLCKLAVEMRLPILAIGLGMQELNVVCGGGLFIHLPEDMPKSIPHHDPHGGAHRHTVVMQPGSRLEQIYGPGEIRVNSYHHQGVRKLAPNFRVGALAPDGLIEAFEGKDPSWWVTGVQWHPENEGNISLDMQLIEAFVEAAAATRSAPQLAKVG